MKQTGSWKRIAVVGAMVVVAAVAILVVQKSADARRTAGDAEEEAWAE